MEDQRQAVEPTRRIVRRIPHEPPAASELPAGFVPLRLLLQPGLLCVELLRPNLTLGRHSTADIRLALPDISRRHCRFLFEDGHWQIVDLNSLNGIYVNGERLRESVLYHEDRLSVGGLTLLVELPAGSGQAVRPPRQDDPEEGMLRKIARKFSDRVLDPTEEFRKAS